MEKEILQKNIYIDDIIRLLRSGLPQTELTAELCNYHERDIAEAFEQLTAQEHKELYTILDIGMMSEIFSYIEDPTDYLRELGPQKASAILSEMDSDDVVDILEDSDEDTRSKIVGLLDEDAEEDVRMILSYGEDEIGSEMTTNYIVIKKGLNIQQATHELIQQAGDNDNIGTVYVVDDHNHYYGAIDLKDLIIARKYKKLEDIISTSYPSVQAHEKISDCIEKLKDYAEDSIPVVSDDNELLGVITAHDIVEVVDEEMGEDYAKLAGLTAEEDLKETLGESMKKRLPWLIILLFLGMGVSSVVGAFESVVAVIPIVICFQSLILDMAGNVGTQSLAVTIRVLMDENLTLADRIKLIFKECKVGFFNGLFLGILAFVFVGLYIFVFKGNDAGYALLVSGCVGSALMLSMVISSLVGTLIPMFFHRIHIDPAVASGPLITTVNDLVAVVTYYGLAWVFLIKIFQMV